MRSILRPEAEKFQPRNEITDPEQYDEDGEQLQMTLEEETMEEQPENEEETLQEDTVNTARVEEGQLKLTLD